MSTSFVLTGYVLKSCDRSIEAAELQRDEKSQEEVSPRNSLTEQSRETSYFWTLLHLLSQDSKVAWLSPVAMVVFLLLSPAVIKVFRCEGKRRCGTVCWHVTLTRSHAPDGPPVYPLHRSYTRAHSFRGHDRVYATGSTRTVGIREHPHTHTRMHIYSVQDTLGVK